jgi:L-iditol 2-dehydrogenase
MKIAAITGPHQSAVLDRPAPQIKGNFVLIKITLSPMCTEFKAYKEGWCSEEIGHEAVGIVVDAPPGARVRAGDRVVVMPQTPCGKCALCTSGDYIYCEHTFDPKAACDSPTGVATYAQYAIKQDWQLIPIPDGMPDAHAAMACCGFGPTFGAMQNMHLDAFDTLLITGLGPVGLGAVINAVYRGARVIGIESNSYRARLALELGAAAVIHPEDPDALQQVRSLTGGRGADKVIDCTAIPAAQKFAIQAARVRGHVSFVGWGGHIELDNMVPRGLTLQGAWHWNLNDSARIMQVIGACGISIDQMVTHTFPLTRVQDAWELQLTGQCGKVMLDPWEA